MGTASLIDSKPSEGLSPEELKEFLGKYHLQPCKGKTPLGVRAAKLKFAIESNPELIDSSRTPEET